MPINLPFAMPIIAKVFDLRRIGMVAPKPHEIEDLQRIIRAQDAELASIQKRREKIRAQTEEYRRQGEISDARIAEYKRQGEISDAKIAEYKRQGEIYDANIAEIRRKAEIRMQNFKSKHAFSIKVGEVISRIFGEDRER